MAERSVIREDVISIGFEVENNPFAELIADIQTLKAQLGILASTEAGLRTIGEEAGNAGEQVADLANSLRGPPENGLSEQVERIGEEAENAGDEMANLRGKMQDVAQQKLTAGIEKLKSGIKAPITGIKNLAEQAKKFATEKLDAGVQKLPIPLKIAGSAVGLVLGKAKELAGIGFQKAASGMKNLAEHAGRAAKALGGKLLSGAKALGKGIATSIVGGSIALAGLGVAGINVGANFEASMSQVAATMGMSADEANYSNETYAKLANTAKEMGESTQFSASEAGEALNYLALAGYDADKACAALPTILDLATAGGMELAAASDMITDSMSALGIETTKENLTAFGDQMAKTSQKSNTSLEQLGEAILTVGGTAKTLSGGTTEMNTLLGIIADSGVKGAEGGTALRNILLSLQAPTDTAAKKMKQLGLDVYDAEGKMRPMQDILGDLNTSMGSMNDQEQQDVLSTLFNKRDLKSVSALLAGTVATTDQLKAALNASGYDVDNLGVSLDKLAAGFDKTQDQEEFVAKAMLGFGMTSDQAQTLFTGLSSVVDGSATRFNELSGYIEHSDGAMANAAETMRDTLRGRVDELNSAIEGLGIAFFESLGSSNLKDLVSQASGWITELTKATKADGINGLVNQIGTTLSNVLITITGYTPELIQAGSSIIHSLVLGIMQNREQIAGSIVEGFRYLTQGILQIAPEVLALGGSILLSLIQGIEQQLPGLLPIGLQAIQQVCGGLMTNAPAIIQSGIGIVLQLINGLIEGLPTILTTGIHMVIFLAKGLISAIPELIKAIPKLISAIIETFTSINWIDVGLDIVKGIGSGIWSGIKGIFGKDKDTGKEITESLTGGIASGSSLTVSSAANTSQEIKSAFDNLDLYSSGQNMMQGLSLGMEEGAVQSTDKFLTGITETLEEVNLQEAGQNVMQGLSLGMEEGAAQSTDKFLTGITEALSETNLQESGQELMKGLSEGIEEGCPLAANSANMTSAKIKEEIDQTDLYSSGGEIIQNLSLGMDGKRSLVTASASSASRTIKNEIDRTDLYSSGQNIMQGLNNGMISMEGTLHATATRIGGTISKSLNASLDIHSPSGITEKTGYFTGLGLIKGMEGTESQVKTESQHLGEITVKNMISYKSRYTPESSTSIPNLQRNSEVNHYSPVFNLTLNGASATDSNERKVKRWVKESMKEYLNGIGRSQQVVQEV